jgi:hypothetical protein
MLDYDAKAAFDRVISSITYVACQRLGLPCIAGTLMHNLLHDMSFHVVAGFRRSTKIFCNADDRISVGQGVLQRSSSTSPIYIFNSDVCISTYRKHGTIARFIHLITGDSIHDSGWAVNYTLRCVIFTLFVLRTISSINASLTNH